MADWDVRDLESWDDRIREKVQEFGLDCFPQEFEIMDHLQMLGAMAYSGMPSHYPHWSYGKAFEKLKTLYDYGVQGLPYEMVINSNPSLAYLMRDNSLLLQILTMAHVYGHNDFFKNNFTFQTTRPEYVLEMFKSHAGRVRSYQEDPSIGVDRVERILNAAHALSLQCRRDLHIRKLSLEDERRRQLAAASPPEDPYGELHRRPEVAEPDLQKLPPQPEADLLLIIRDHNAQLADWERDLITIVHDEARYFLPQIETKIINEGWATFWHREILNSLELPPDLHLEFLVRHNQVVRPTPGSLNPYHIGLKLWDSLDGDARRGGEGRARLFDIRAADRDVSFLRRFLTPERMRELDLFQHRPEGDERVVAEVADDEGWERIKATLLKNVGMGSIPVIKAVDVDHSQSGAMLLEHYHEGRDLELGYAERTLEHLHQLWGRGVVLGTVLGGEAAELVFDDDGFVQGG